MKRMIMMLAVGAAISGWLLLVPVEAKSAKSAACPPDSVRSGPTCMDKYEALVLRIPPTNPAGKSNASLINKVKTGTVTAAILTAAGATRLGESSDDYAPCNDNGTNCTDVFAVSLPGVTPSVYITWFQAQQACKNSGKRLPSNAEWQAAVAGTPDPGPDNGTTDCNTYSTFVVAATGSRSSCVSADGAFDMVGNLDEWVAEWVPQATACPDWGGFSNDSMCLAGAWTTAGPGALARGGAFGQGAAAGPLAVDGRTWTGAWPDSFVFRCARPRNAAGDTMAKRLGV